MLVENPQQSTNNLDSIHSYLREIGRIPLLTPQQEIVYGHQVHQMMSLLLKKEALTITLRREPTLAEWAAQVQLSQAQLDEALRQGQQAKQKMISANLRLVVAVAKKYQKRDLDLLDLIQEGSSGLVRAVEKFDPTRGYKLSTYCWHWIRQALTRAIANQARVIRLPIHIFEKLNKIKKAQRQLSLLLGRTPTISEIAVEAGLTPLQVRECLERTKQPISLSLRVGNELDTELGDLLENTDETPEEFVMKSALSDELEQLIADLTPQQKLVLTLRFGLSDGQAKTLAEVSTLR